MIFSYLLFILIFFKNFNISLTLLFLFCLYICFRIVRKSCNLGNNADLIALK